MANLTISLNDLDKQRFSEFCEYNGMSVSTAVNMFVKKVLDCGFIPFTIGKKPNRELRAAIKEAEKIAKHPERYKSYKNFDELLEDL